MIPTMAWCGRNTVCSAEIASSCFDSAESGNYHVRTARVSMTAGGKELKTLHVCKSINRINSELLRMLLLVT